MKRLTLILLLLTASGSDGLWCMIPEDNGKNLSFANLDYEEFFKRLEDSPTTEDIPDALCRVIIKLNYHDQMLVMRFTTDMYQTFVNLGEVEFMTDVLPMDDGQFYVRNHMEHICSGNGCEIAFLKTHLRWLVNVRFPTLVENTVPFLTHGTGGAAKCFDDESGIDEDCPSGICSLDVLEYMGELGIVALCNPPIRRHPIQLHVMHIMNLNNLTRDYNSGIMCDYDGCNTEQTADKLRVMLDTHYNITDLIEVLASAKTSEETEEATAATTLSSTTSTSAKNKIFMGKFKN